MVERVIRTLSSQCVYRHRSEIWCHASRGTGDEINFYSNGRSHQSLGIRTLAEVFKVAA